MTDWDRLPAGRRAARCDQLLARYLREEVLPFSDGERARLDAAGVGSRPRGTADLIRLPPVTVEDVDGIGAVLRPTAEGLARSPERWRWWWAGFTRRRGAFVETELDPRFRAIHFDDHGDLVVASSAADLDRLADLGRRWLGLVGVRLDDAVVSLLPARGDLAFWQLSMGCRGAGIPALHLGQAVTAEAVAGYAPTVLAGSVPTLRRIASEAAAGEIDLTSVRLVLVIGALGDRDRVDLGTRLAGSTVRAALAAPGVRALWVECRAGGLHTWPDAEVVEVLDGDDRPTAGVGSVVWSPIGWRGTVVLRLRTGRHGRLVDGICRCGATSPRLALVDAEPPPPDRSDADRELEAALAAVLDREPLVAAWVASTGDELVVRLAPVRGGRAELESELGRIGGRLGADRVVVERPSSVRQRLEDAGGAHVVAEPARGRLLGQRR